MALFLLDIWKDIPFFKLYPLISLKEIKFIPALLSLGIKWVQIREKEENLNNFIEEISKFVKLAESYNGKIIINDNLDIANKTNAQGLHLGQEDLSPKEARELLGKKATIGLSCYERKEILDGLKNPYVDYIAIGPIYSTPFKDKKPVGLKILKDYLNKGKEIVAIGGINKENIIDVLNTGVDKIAFIRLLKDIIKK